MRFFKKGLAGPGYVVLNVIRVMNIISLLAVIAASVVMLVKTFIVSKFFFFDAVTHVVEAWVSIFLIISELSLFQSWFINNWPTFGQHAGFGGLGGAMIVLGNSLLAFLNKDSTNEKSLGLAFWRIVISAGIVAIVMGFINVFSTWIFQDRKNHVSARQVRTYGAVASHKVQDEMMKSPDTVKLTRKDSLPSYYSRSTTPRNAETRQHPPKLPLTISRPIPNDAEQFAKFETTPDVQAPDLAHHPAMMGERI